MRRPCPTQNPNLFFFLKLYKYTPTTTQRLSPAFRPVSLLFPSLKPSPLVAHPFCNTPLLQFPFRRMRPDSSFNATSLSGQQLQQQHSPWHSPVPYLFGGLAAMLGLIAFALLILACSYWKLSGYFENGEGSQGGEVGEEGEKPLEIKVCSGLEDQKIVVIMAGDQKPSFIATPMSSKGSSINLTKGLVDSCDHVGEKKQVDDHNQSHEHLQVQEDQNQVHHPGQNQEEEQHQSQRQNQGDENQ